MSISDSARERARIARLKALESEERVQNYGDLADSRATVINYDPDKGYLVRALNGEIGYATNISGTQLGVGATVQATRKGNGFIIDYFDKSSGKGNDSDSNDLAKQAFGDTSTSTGFSPVWIGFGGVDPSTSTVGYKPDGQGGCDVKTYPKDKKLPEGVYATAKECQDSQKEGSFKCVNGNCIDVTDGSGKYKTKAECEAALVLGFWVQDIPGDPDYLGVPVVDVGDGWQSAGISGTYRPSQVTFWGEKLDSLGRNVWVFEVNGTAIAGGFIQPSGRKYGLYDGRYPNAPQKRQKKCP